MIYGNLREQVGGLRLAGTWQVCGNLREKVEGFAGNLREIVGDTYGIFQGPVGNFFRGHIGDFFNLRKEATTTTTTTTTA